MGDGIRGHTLSVGATCLMRPDELAFVGRPFTWQVGEDRNSFRITDPIDDPAELGAIMSGSGLTRSDVARITGSSKTAVDSWLRPRGNAAARRMPGSKAALLRMAVAVKSAETEKDAVSCVCEHTSEVGMQIARKCGLIGQRRG